MLTLRKPWTRQPQAAATVAVGDQFAAGLAHLVWAPGPVDVVSRRSAVRNGTSLAVGTRGIGLTSVSAATGADFGPFRVTTSDGAGTGDFAVCVVGNPATSAGRSIVTGGLSGVSPEPYITFNGTAIDGNRSGGIAFVWGANGVRSNSTTVVDSQYHVFMVCRVGGVMSMYVDGINLATTTAGTVSSTINSSGQNLRIGGYSSGSYGLNSTIVPLVAWWNRGFSSTQAHELAVNVWRLFAPRHIYIPTSAAAPAVPTLTSITSSLITTTGARLTVAA